MNANPKKFGVLLTEAIRHIQSLEPTITIGGIQQELGETIDRVNGNSTLYYWRNGHIPADHSEVAKLARVIIHRAKPLGRRWLKDFLLAADYPHIDTLCDELFPAYAIKPTAYTPEFLPGKTYLELIGRESLIKDLMFFLEDKNRRRMIGIDGLGGIGKTALAREIADKVLKEKLFDTAVWISTPRSNLTSTKPNQENLLSYDSILDSIGQQISQSEMAKMTLHEKEVHLNKLFKNQAILLVLDNLETAGKLQDELPGRLLPLLGRSKVLLTSRRRFKGDVFAIHLEGLETRSALSLIHQVAEERHIVRVQRAKLEEMAPIVKSTGGSPQAIKLVTGQLAHFSMKIVLDHLQNAKPLDFDLAQDEYVQFYRSIYSHSWRVLSSESARNLLIAMTPFMPGLGGTIEAIVATSSLSLNKLKSQLHELWRLSLVEVDNMMSSDLVTVRYYLHPLTQYFVLSDILQVLGEGQ